MAVHWIRLIKSQRDFQDIPTIRHIGYESRESPDYQCLLGHWERQPRGINQTTIQLTLSGTGEVRYQKQVLAVPTGHGFIVGSTGEIVKWGYPQDGTEPWTFIWLEIYGENLLNFSQEIIKHRGPVFNFDPSATIINSLMQFEHYSWQKEMAVDIQNELIYALQLLVLKGSKKKPPAKGNRLVNQALRKIDQRIKEPINTFDIANDLHVSREHLSRSFKKNLNTSLYKYILSKKLSEASSHLSNNDYTIAEISDLYSFSSPTLFCRQFKQQFGMTPSKFKNRYNS